MISISISCEESEIPGVMALLAGVIGSNRGGVITIPADCQPVEEKLVDKLSENLIIVDKPADYGKVEPVFSPLGDLKIADFPPRKGMETPPRSICDLDEDQIAQIATLHAAGKTMDEIKAATGLYDGRIISGVIRRGKPRRQDRRDPLEADDKAAIILERRAAGANRYEVAQDLGVPAPEIKKTFQAAAKKDAEEAHQKVVSELKPINHPPETIKRVLALHDSNLTPKSISDAIEEESGVIVSAAEIMDIIVRRSKGLLPQGI